MIDDWGGVGLVIGVGGGGVMSVVGFNNSIVTTILQLCLMILLTTSKLIFIVGDWGWVVAGRVEKVVGGGKGGECRCGCWRCG